MTFLVAFVLPQSPSAEMENKSNYQYGALNRLKTRVRETLWQSWKVKVLAVL